MFCLMHARDMTPLKHTGVFSKFTGLSVDIIVLEMRKASLHQLGLKTATNRKKVVSYLYVLS